MDIKTRNRGRLKFFITQWTLMEENTLWINLTNFDANEHAKSTDGKGFG